MILIAASMSLLVIVAGMFLLAKTQKENLSNLFKYVSYFIILVGFLNLFGGGAIFMAKKFMKRGAAQHENHCKKDNDCHKKKKHKKACSGMNECEGGSGEMCIEKRIIINGEEMSEEGMKKDCCKDKMVKKDSVVIMKK